VNHQILNRHAAHFMVASGDHQPIQAEPTVTDPLCWNVNTDNLFAIPKSFHCSHFAALPLGLRPTHPCATAVGRETCSTPVINRQFSMKSRLNNCYCNQDLRKLQLQQTHQQPASLSHSRHSTWSGSCLSETLQLAFTNEVQFFFAAQPQFCIGLDHAGFSAINFPGRALRQVSCYTLLSGFQPSWPPSCYQ